MKLKWPPLPRYARFNIYRVSRDSRFGAIESRKEHLTKSFSETKEKWVFGKCVGREGSSKITDCDFEKTSKVIRLLYKSMIQRTDYELLLSLGVASLP